MPKKDKNGKKKTLPMPPINSNGYVRKGFNLDGTRKNDTEGKQWEGIEENTEDGKEQKPEICHVHEMTMSETVEKLEGGGRRTGSFRGWITALLTEKD